jgi:hypothetical protein
MARTGMANLILQIRRRCNVATDSYTLGGTAYFSDDQIEEILDRHRESVRQYPLDVDPVYVDGAHQYLDYSFGSIRGEIEQSATGSGFAIRTSGGVAVTTGFSVNYQAKVVSFTADQANAAYYLDCRAYDANLATADVWGMIASFERQAVDWSSDNHSIKSSQALQNALMQEKHYRRLAGGRLVEQYRVDTLLIEEWR